LESKDEKIVVEKAKIEVQTKKKVQGLKTLLKEKSQEQHEFIHKLFQQCTKVVQSRDEYSKTKAKHGVTKV